MGADCQQVRAETDDLAAFLDGGRGYVGRLSGIGEWLARRRAVATATLGAGPVDEAGPALRRLLGAAEETNRFVAGVHTDLLSVIYQPALAAAITDGLAPPDDAIRQRVAEALRAGATPSEAGLDRAYFPAGYLRVLELDDQIEGAAGGSWRPWDRRRLAGYPQPAADRRHLDELRSELADLVIGLGLDGQRRMGELAATLAIGRATGGSAWAGRHLAAVHIDHLDRGLVGEGWADRRALLGHDRPGFEVIGPYLADDREAALAFYNHLGAARAALLPTVLAEGGSAGSIAHYGRALAAASGMMDGGGRPRLRFGGDDLVGAPPPPLGHDVIRHSPVLLLADGRFHRRFLADATAEALRRADREGALATHTRFTGHLDETPWTLQEGEDPRNLLLSQVVRQPGTAALVVEALAARPDGLGPLVAPVMPFQPSLATDGSDRSGDSGREAVPMLDGRVLAYPVTAFLAQVGADDRASGVLLRAIAGQAEPVLGDPGLAAGVDLVLASHATIAYGGEDLVIRDAVGAELGRIARTALAGSVTAGQWRAVHRAVLDAGRGQALADSHHRLLEDALRLSAADGRFHAGQAEPFALLAARHDTAATQAMFRWAAGLDDGARHRAWQRSVAVNDTLGLLGLVPYVGVLATIGGGAWARYGDRLARPDGHELAARRQQFLDEVVENRGTAWQAVILDAMLADALAGPEPTVELRHPRTGELVSAPLWRDEEGRHWWTDPASGDHHRLDGEGAPRLDDLFPNGAAGTATPIGQAITDTAGLSGAYHAGRLSALDPDQLEDIGLPATDDGARDPRQPRRRAEAQAAPYAQWVG